MTMISFVASELCERYDGSLRLEKYAELLFAENQKVNLVSRETDTGALHVMIAESLLPLLVIEGEIGSYLDIGSGGGLPAIPIMISGRVSGMCALIERTKKKAAALSRIISAMSLTAEILPEDFLSTSLSFKPDLVTIRYLTPDQSILKRISKILNPGGRLVHYSSKPVESTLFDHRTWQYQTSQAGVVKGFTLYQKK